MIVASLRLILLVTAAIAFHEMGMAAGGHGLASAEPGPTCGEVAAAATHHHHQHHHAVTPGEIDPAPADVAETCLDVRTVAPLSRMAAVDFDAPPAAAPPIPILQEWHLFTSTSRVLVTNPPADPTDIERSLWQVYRI